MICLQGQPSLLREQLDRADPPPLSLSPIHLLIPSSLPPSPSPPHRMLQGKLEQPISNPPSPADFNQGDRANNLSSHIQHLRNEVTRFREQLTSAQEER